MTQPRALRLTLSLAFALALGCGASAATDAGPNTPDAGAEPDAGSVPSTIGPEERPARVVVPSAHDGSTPLPLLVLLHGYGATAELQNALFGLGDETARQGVYLLLPDGTVDVAGNRFWNATDACCNLGGSDVDDVAYLRGLVEEMKARFPIDARRVYFFGHSNGGFMSYRMACEMADEVAAVASLAGVDYLADDACVPSRPVSVLQIHGTADEVIYYEGGVGAGGGRLPEIPSARTSVTRWAGRASCDVESVSELPMMDLERSIDGAETHVERWESGCEPGLDAELWSIERGAHIPAFHRQPFSEALLDWLLRHER